MSTDVCYKLSYCVLFIVYSYTKKEEKKSSVYVLFRNKKFMLKLMLIFLLVLSIMIRHQDVYSWKNIITKGQNEIKNLSYLKNSVALCMTKLYKIYVWWIIFYFKLLCVFLNVGKNFNCKKVTICYMLILFLF